MTKESLAMAAGMSSNTLYEYLRGDGVNAEVEKIMALADAAGVARPAIDRSLRFSAAAVGSPPALALLREAGAAIGAATRLLEAENARRLTTDEKVQKVTRVRRTTRKQKPGEDGEQSGDSPA